MMDHGLKSRFEVIDAIADRVGQGTKTWIDSLRRDVISSYRAVDVNDVPSLVSFVRMKGPALLETRYVIANFHDMRRAVYRC